MPDISKYKEIFKKYEGDRSALIAILQDIQAECNYLPREFLENLSDDMKVPLSRIYSIATFFKAFSLKPRGKYTVNICMGTACQVRGSQRVFERFQRELGVKEGDTTPDLKFSLHKMYCLGCCGLAPVAMVGKDIHGKISQTQVPKILKQYK